MRNGNKEEGSVMKLCLSEENAGRYIFVTERDDTRGERPTSTRVYS